jgi:hypothetical protein
LWSLISIPIIQYSSGIYDLTSPAFLSAVFLNLFNGPILHVLNDGGNTTRFQVVARTKVRSVYEDLHLSSTVFNIHKPIFSAKGNSTIR